MIINTNIIINIIIIYKYFQSLKNNNLQKSNI